MDNLKTSSVNLSAVQSLLKETLRLRQEKNPKYSMRSFAENLKMSASLLSQIMSGKKGLTYRSFVLIAKGLNLSEKDSFKIFNEIEIKKKNKKLPKLERIKVEGRFIEEICHWKFLAVLGLANVVRNKFDPLWVSKRLGVGVDEAAEILNHLFKHSFIALNDSEGFKSSTNWFSVESHTESSVIKRLHKSALEKSLETLYSKPKDQRLFTSLYLPSSPEILNDIEAEFNKFNDKIVKIAGSSGRVKEPLNVYQFSCQFIPVTDPE